MRLLLISLLVFCLGCGRPYTDAEKKRFEEHRDDPDQYHHTR